MMSGTSGLIGGIGTIEGPIIGALLYYFLRDFFKEYETWYLIGSGVAAVLAALVGRLTKYAARARELAAIDQALQPAVELIDSSLAQLQEEIGRAHV